MDLTQAAISEIIGKYLEPFQMGTTVSKAIRRLSDPAQDLNLIGHEVAANQAYRHLLLKYASARRQGSRFADKDEVARLIEAENLDKVTGIFGRGGFRSLLFSAQIKRNVGKDWPKKQDQSLDLDGARIFPFAIELEEFCEQKRIPNPLVAFEAGVLFDWVLNLSKALKKDKGTFPEFSAKVQKASHRTANIAYRLGGQLPSFKLQRYAFAMPVVVAAGRCLMAMIFDGKNNTKKWAEFEEKVVEYKRDVPEIVPSFEKTNFGLTHTKLTSYLCKLFDPFKEIATAAEWSQDPILIKKSNGEQYRLALVYYTADRMATFLTSESKENDIKNFLGTELLKEAQEVGMGMSQIKMTLPLLKKA